MTTRDWAVDAAEDAMLFCDNPVIDENNTLITDPTKQMYMLADRIRGLAHLARGERDGEVVAIDETDRTAPERIYLQVDGDGDNNERAEAFPNFADYEVTWCAQSQGGLEVEYVRSDLAHPRPAVPEAWEDPTGFSVAGIRDEAKNWTRRETGKQMLLNYAAALEAGTLAAAPESGGV